MKWELKLTGDEVLDALAEWAAHRFNRTVAPDAVRINVAEGSVDPREPGLPHVTGATIKVEGEAL